MLTTDPVLAATPYPGGIWEPGPARYGMTATQTNVPITMADGTVLNAAVIYPAILGGTERAPGAFPVVLEHTIYVGAPNNYFPRYGYISVKVNSRGAGLSTGVQQAYGPLDQSDGKALVEWAAHQLDGADGRVAMNGCSFPGGQALANAAAVGPSSPLKAVVSSCAGLEVLDREAWTHNGLLAKGMNGIVGAGNSTGGTPGAIAFWQGLHAEILGGGPAAYAGSEYWQQRTPMSKAADIVNNNVPVLLWTGWLDLVEMTALRTYVGFQNAYAKQLNPAQYGTQEMDAQMKRTQPTTPRYQIIIGNWGHGAGLDNGIILQWFETWLNGVNTGIQSTKTPMHLFETNSNRWVNTAVYPPVKNYTSFYLNGSGSNLTSTAPTNSQSNALYWGDMPAMALNALNFTTPAFAQGATLAGPIGATIYASSNNTNLELIARLDDVAPDGTLTKVSEGAFLASLREQDSVRTWTDGNGVNIWPLHKLVSDSYITPGQVYRFDLALPARQWAVLPGHQLRLTLVGQNANTTQTCGAGLGPEICPLLMTPQQLATLPGGIYTILQGGATLSALNLPLAPSSAFPTAASSATPTSANRVMPQDWGNQCSDLLAGRAAMGARSNTARYNDRTDMDANGVIDIRDIAALARLVPAGSACQ